MYRLNAVIDPSLVGSPEDSLQMNKICTFILDLTHPVGEGICFEEVSNQHHDVSLKV